ncbi:hypothetical protein AKJ57_05095 [candidate division MSBL1 archaeon SCGC-AAA259A05]|uniref:UPF0280 protein AKJ57_05095 n=1 Tax=candidate division MSBL1 archaeon SCGC-AAA259A05 TaxID=1698259 RepID=A0A133U5Y8_9EURY|nr:hypothetical protein AKJ57_05095 [candidate division MSBL1 archaeon SCGC-AAA259A05]
MHERRWSRKETELTIKSDSKRAIKSAIDAALGARRELERYVFKNPDFRTSLDPMSPKGRDYPEVVGLMRRASEIVEIGPFAAVAGTISQMAAEAGERSGADAILVDNGGDIAMIGNRGFQVGIYSGLSSISGRLVLTPEPEDLPLGICTSSGTFGHSLSFGGADAVAVISEESSIADAAATAVGNEVEGDDVESSVKRGLDRADDLPEVGGCLIVREDFVGVVGSLPEISTLPEGKEVLPRELLQT